MITTGPAATFCDLSQRELFARAGVSTAARAPLPDTTLTSLTDDSRAVKPGGCFVAVRGGVCDGHRFLEDAARAGAALIVVDREVTPPHGPVLVRVDDSRAALARLAAAWFGLRRDRAHAPRLIGITGTNGKTTVAWLLRSILQSAGRRPALLGTIEYDLLSTRQAAPMTTPGPLALYSHLAAARDAGASDAILEVSSHALAQHRCEGLSFSAGVFTNLSGDHLDYHGTVESYAEAKRRLFDSLDAASVAVVRHNDPVAQWMVKRCAAPTITFGLDYAGAHVGAQLERMDASGCRFVLKAPGFEIPVTLSLLGRHNVANALSAAATACALGVEADAIRTGLEAVTHVPGRLQRVEPAGCPFVVLVDYAHTDDALKHVLKAVRSLTRGRLICVFGCGGDRDRSKRPRMAAAVGGAADVAYVTSDNPRSEDPKAIIDDIVAGFESVAQTAPGGHREAERRCRVEVKVERQEAIGAALDEARPGDTVLIAGKGHETYQLVGDEVLSFDDVAVVRGCFERTRSLETVT